jgi:YggT family protein
MFVFDILLAEIWRIVSWLLTIYTWVVIAAVLVTWVNPDPWNPIVRFLRKVTEPVFARIRRWLPFVVIGGLDLSPLVLLLAIQLVDRVVTRALWQMARGF